MSSDLYGYFSRYLNDTATVIDDNSQAQSIFQSDQTQLNQLQTTIDNDNNAANTAYNDSVGWANDGNSYEDQHDYNVYVADLGEANSTIDQYNQLIQQFNTLVTAYNGTQPVAQIPSVQVQGSHN